MQPSELDVSDVEELCIRSSVECEFFSFSYRDNEVYSESSEQIL